jgi:hypothetical protein
MAEPQDLRWTKIALFETGRYGMSQRLARIQALGALANRYARNDGTAQLDASRQTSG